MAAIDRIRDKYLEQNPTRDPLFAVPPDWVAATAAVLDEVIAENKRAVSAIIHRNDSA
ncbi:hypothetical protein [Limnoglobus roseus]|uniref:Uncharacterized protein n=1 Tax=Limnoglobus roseus TaxID=2598579 RepID=A0A5C1AH51_9BACT|nr:hypothetical protein [Limnoglobus roseus]QEL18749.1 hypothetical protein PX52LOC_05786 [Limnoglobus roseus]